VSVQEARRRSRWSLRQRVVTGTEPAVLANAGFRGRLFRFKRRLQRWTSSVATLPRQSATLRYPSAVDVKRTSCHR